MSRHKFSETEVLATAQLMMWGQQYSHLHAYLLCHRCKESLFDAVWNEDKSRIVAAIAVGKLEREHLTELALGGADSPQNCVYSHAGCHSKITNGTKATTAGSSKHKIAKTKRLAAGGKRRKGPAIRSKPFPKTSRPFQKRKK